MCVIAGMDKATRKKANEPIGRRTKPQEKADLPPDPKAADAYHEAGGRAGSTREGKQGERRQHQLCVGGLGY